MEVFYRLFAEHWTSQTASLDKPFKALQGSSIRLPDCKPISRSIRFTGGLLHSSDMKGSASHFRLVFLMAAAMFQPFFPGLWLLLLPALSLVPVSAFSPKSYSCLPVLVWLLLPLFILSLFCSAMILFPTSLTQFLLLASPALLRHCCTA